MTVEGFFVWAVFFGFCFMFGTFILGLCKVAGRPTPSPLDRVVDYDVEDDLDLDWKIGGTD